MILDWAQETVGLVPIWLLVVLALLAGFVESTPVLGILIPANSLVFLLGLHWANIQRWPVDLLGAYAVGSFLGDIAFFGVGRRYGLRFMEEWPGLLRLSAERREALERLVDAHGGKAVLIARFQPVTRSFAPYVAGAAKMPAGRFLLAAAVASLGMAAVVVASGYLTGLGLRAVGKAVGWVAASAVAAIAILAIVYFWLTRHLKLVSHATLSLTLGAAMATGALAALVVGRLASTGWTAREVAAWPRLLDQVDLGAAGSAVALLGHPYTVLAAAIAWCAFLAWGKDWRGVRLVGGAAFGTALAAGVLQALMGRSPPGAASLPLQSGFPGAATAVAVALAMVGVWLWPALPHWRRRLAGVAMVLGTAVVAAASILAGQVWPTQAAGGAALGAICGALVLLMDINVQNRRQVAVLDRLDT